MGSNGLLMISVYLLMGGSNGWFVIRELDEVYMISLNLSIGLNPITLFPPLMGLRYLYIYYMVSSSLMTYVYIPYALLYTLMIYPTNGISCLRY